jgi:hypothetical protein
MINFISLKIGRKWRVLARKTVIFNEKHQNSLFQNSKKVKGAHLFTRCAPFKVVA